MASRRGGVSGAFAVLATTSKPCRVQPFRNRPDKISFYGLECELDQVKRRYVGGGQVRGLLPDYRRSRRTTSRPPDRGCFECSTASQGFSLLGVQRRRDATKVAEAAALPRKATIPKL